MNSPWNISTDFNIDMSLSKEGITDMLKEYEADHQTGMNEEEMAGLIYDYTSGYPYLVFMTRTIRQLMLPRCLDLYVIGMEMLWFRTVFLKQGFITGIYQLLKSKGKSYIKPLCRTGISLL